jgi:uncharacterized protein YjbJ (UPF0337 family)
MTNSTAIKTTHIIVLMAFSVLDDSRDRNLRAKVSRVNRGSRAASSSSDGLSRHARLVGWSRIRTCTSVSEPDIRRSSESVVSSDLSTHQPRENKMGEIIDKVKGKIKQAAGSLTGDKKLEQEGQVDSAKGKVKGAVEDVKHAVKK